MAPQHYNKTTVASACLSLICSLGIPILSWNEHIRSVSPSNLLCVYLLFSTLFDGVQARTLWLRFPSTIAGTCTAGLGVRFLLLIAESQEKQTYLKPQFANYSPEKLGGMVNRIVFWWLNPLLARGSRGLLSPSYLFPIDPNLSAEVAQAKFESKWSLSTLRPLHVKYFDVIDVTYSNELSPWRTIWFTAGNIVLRSANSDMDGNPPDRSDRSQNFAAVISELCHSISLRFYQRQCCWRGACWGYSPDLFGNGSTLLYQPIIYPLKA